MMGGALGGLEAMFLRRGRGVLAVGQYGRGARGNDTFAFDGSHIRPGADPRHQRIATGGWCWFDSTRFSVLVLKRSILTEKIARGVAII